MSESLAEGASDADTSTTETDTDANTTGNTEGTDTDTSTGSEGDNEDKSKTSTRGKYAGKYDTPEDLEKGYKESSKTVKELQEKIKDFEEKETLPEDFDIVKELKGVQGLPEDLEIDEEDTVFKHMIPALKEAGVSPEQAKHLAAEYIKMELGEIPDKEKEIASLGDNAKETLGKIDKILQGLPETQANILRGFTTRADEIQTLVAFAKAFQAGEKQIPARGNETPLKTARELEEEAFAYKKANERSIGSNKSQQEHYNTLMQQAQAAKEAEDADKRKRA